MRGTFKCLTFDDELSGIGEYEELYYPNIWELINSPARTLAYEQLNGVNAP